MNPVPSLTHRSLPRPGAPLWLPLLLSLLWIGCDRAPSAPAPPPPPEAAAPSTARAAIEAWGCDDPLSCLGWEVGVTREYERSVGATRNREVWRIDDAYDTDAGGVAFTQSGGKSSHYTWSPEGLSMTLRGEPLEVFRFPVGATASTFEVDDRAGGKVQMYLEHMNEAMTTSAGTFSPCMRHEARFLNTDTPGEVRLRIETVFCRGVGEVLQRVVLDGMPLPVERVLIGHQPVMRSTADASAPSTP